MAAKKTTSKKTEAEKPAAKKEAPKKAETPKAVTKKTSAKAAEPTEEAKVVKAVAKEAAPKAPKEESHDQEGETTIAANGLKLGGFVVKQRQRLLDLRDEIFDAMSGVTRDTLRNAPEGSEASGSGMHQGDAGSDAYDRDFALSVLAKEQDAIYEIEEALRRIDKGVYGVCEMSGKKIPQARLEAIPFARLTVECQAQWEKEFGNRRFRPTNEVGFSGGHYYEEDENESVSLDEDED